MRVLRVAVRRSFKALFSMATTLFGFTRIRSLLAHVLDVQMITDLVRIKAGNALTPFYSVMVFHETQSVASQHGVQGDRVLEIGPGSSLTTLACFLAAGGKRAVGLDIQPMDMKGSSFYRQAANYIVVASGIGWWRFMADHNPNPSVRYHSWGGDNFLPFVERVEYVAPCSADATPFEDASFDLIFSNAVLEHVDSPEDVVEEMWRILEPGGLCIHTVDMRDHDSTNPIEFLKYSSEEWAEVTRKYGGGAGIERIIDGTWEKRVFCNRYLTGDWHQLFKRVGFDILSEETLCSVAQETIDLATLDPVYRDRDLNNLSRVVVRFILRRPENLASSAAG